MDGKHEDLLLFEEAENKISTLRNQKLHFESFSLFLQAYKKS